MSIIRRVRVIIHFDGRMIQTTLCTRLYAVIIQKKVTVFTGNIQLIGAINIAFYVNHFL